MRRASRMALWYILCFAFAGAYAQTVQVSGTVHDPNGKGLAGARVTLLETGQSASTDSNGVFHLQGSLAVFQPKLRDEGLTWRLQGLALQVENRSDAAVELSWWREDGTREWKRRLPPQATQAIAVETHPLSMALRILVVRRGAQRTAYPVLVRGSEVVALNPPAAAKALARAAVTDTLPRMTLEFTDSGYLTRRLRLRQFSDSVAMELLPQSAGLKQQIQLFIGDSLDLRVAWLSYDAVATAYYLNYADLAEMGDTLVTHTFATSKGATLPAWSPDGNYLTYETGLEGATVNNGSVVSRVYIQALSGARIDGPGYPATNPRFWTDGVDTALVWCSSGDDYGWNDTGKTYWQQFSGGQLIGSPRILAAGSYNAGLSQDSNWLAGGSPRAVLLNRGTGQKIFLHVYPGSPSPLPDSVQVCNMSISPDPAQPARALFEDFGVFDAPGYPNLVAPKLYAQHQILLIGDATSTLPGHIVDFIDTPPAELALGKTWDDPEWSNRPDYAVASTRGLDANGNPVQPDLYLIKISTRETLKLASGAGFYMPIAWLGSK